MILQGDIGPSRFGAHTATVHKKKTGGGTSKGRGVRTAGSIGCTPAFIERCPPKVDGEVPSTTESPSFDNNVVLAAMAKFLPFDVRFSNSELQSEWMP